MAKKRKDYGTGIPKHEIEALARALLPTMQAFFESEEGKRERYKVPLLPFSFWVIVSIIVFEDSVCSKAECR